MLAVFNPLHVHNFFMSRKRLYESMYLLQINVFITKSHRWRGDCGFGHLWHNAVHSQPHLHVVCGPGCQHGQLAVGSRHTWHEAFTAQRTDHGASAFGWGQGKTKDRMQVCGQWMLMHVFQWCDSMKRAEASCDKISIFSYLISDYLISDLTML